MSRSQPQNIIRLAVEVTNGSLKMSDVHATLKKAVQRVLDSGAVSHMTKSKDAPEPVSRFTGSGTRRARTS